MCEMIPQHPIGRAHTHTVRIPLCGPTHGRHVSSPLTPRQTWTADPCRSLGDPNRLIISQKERQQQKREQEKKQKAKAAAERAAPPISKSQARKLAQIEARKQKEASRKQVLATLAAHEMKDSQLRLLSSSGALGHTMSKKQRLQRTMHAHKEGAALDDLEPLEVEVDRPSDDGEMAEASAAAMDDLDDLGDEADDAFWASQAMGFRWQLNRWVERERHRREQVAIERRRAAEANAERAKAAKYSPLMEKPQPQSSGASSEKVAPMQDDNRAKAKDNPQHRDRTWVRRRGGTCRKGRRMQTTRAKTK